jgi:hypothetical protein
MDRLRQATRRSILDWAEAHLSAGRSFYGLARIASFSSSPHPSGPQGERDARAGAGRAGRGGGRVSGEGGEGEGRQAESAPVVSVGVVVVVEEEEEKDLAPPAKRPRSHPRSDLALHMVAQGGGSGNGSGGGQGGKCKRGEVETSSAVYALITCHRHTPGAKCVALPLLQMLHLLELLELLQVLQVLQVLELRRSSPFLSFRLVWSGLHRQCDGCWHACHGTLRQREARPYARLA